MVLVDQPAAGRPQTCPENAVDPMGEQRPGPLDAACSFSDFAGGPLVRIEGKVLAEGDGPLPSPLPDTVVSVHRVEADGVPPRLGPRLARLVTDAQGGFSLSAMLAPGPYVAVIATAHGPPVQRRFELAPGERSIRDLRIIVAPDAAFDEP